MSRSATNSRLQVVPQAPDVERRAKVLIVDDDERNLLALTEVLQPLADIVTVASGRDALRALLRDDFAVILLDVFMPEMDGYETAAFIREREQTARIPIIFLSAVNKETEHLMRGYAMGAVDYVFKPVDPLILRSKAAVFVDLYRLRREIEERNRAERELEAAKLRAEEQRLEIERELQATRLRQAAILNSLPVVLFEASYSPRDGLRRRVVGGDEHAFAKDTAPWIRGDAAEWEERIVPEDRAIVIREYAGKTETGDRATVRYRWIGDGDAPHNFLEQAVRTGEDTWVGSITDITAQSALENQLMQAQKLDALGQLTGGVAHDFNNLLAAILGGLEVLKRRVQLPEPALEIVAQLGQAANEGVALVKSLLAFARKQPLIPVAVDPDQLRKSTLGLAEHALGSRYRIDWQSDCGDCQFYADPAQLTLAVLNLIINARDAMPDGGTIEVTAGRNGDEDERDVRLRIVVRDHGSGIPSAIAERITEPFFTTKPAGKGTGLGLSMVAGFVEQSGGTLAFITPPDGGTAVEIILPTARPCAIAPDEPSEPNLSEQRRRSILLVDDDEMVRMFLAEMLEDMGLRVTTAEDGQAALDRLRGRDARFDLVLSDIAMPRMTGIELVDAMMREQIDVPITLMSGNPSPEICAQLPNELVVLAKPLSGQTLRELLASI